MLKRNIFYFLVIASVTKKENLDKVFVVKHINSVIRIFDKYSSVLKKKLFIAKYHDKLSYGDIVSDIYEILKKLDLPHQIVSVLFHACVNNSFKDLISARDLLMRKWNLLILNIVSPVAIDDAEQSLLTSKIKEKMKNVVNVIYNDDKSLIDGNVFIFNSIKIDDSISVRLDQILNELSR